MAFFRHLALVLKPCLFLPGEFIVHKGDAGYGMFFLYRGEVSISNSSCRDLNRSLPQLQDKQSEEIEAQATSECLHS